MGQVGQQLGNVFGQKDPNATNDVLNGQVVATGTPGAATVKDPNQGLSLGNRVARGAVGGLGRGLQQFGQQQNGFQRGPNPNSMFFGG